MDQARRLKELEQENAKLKRLVSELLTPRTSSQDCNVEVAEGVDDGILRRRGGSIHCVVAHSTVILSR